ncbi:glycosyltransferase family 2 protein [Gluconobacter albidus]|uniref:glycosyltransferase family 2 protein n=1 Tax=Gluconobacter albidus TaxID=318683 RepID=UPI00098BB536|nr:glycosyltransferase family A protein [Gluconobacter albidus]
MTNKLGIGIITYNRKSILSLTIENIRKFTNSDFEFVIADDGSSDGTIEYLNNSGIKYITGVNKGISWNRNRALWYLKNEKNCENIIILEDDCSPNEFGWEKQWIEAIENFGHINYMPEGSIENDNDISSGSGTPNDPFIAPMHQALCVGYSSRALDFVGYLDIRFKKYGEEHVEHTHRFLRAGYGGLIQHLRPERGQLYYLRGGLSISHSESHGNNDLISYNKDIHEQIKNDPIYRSPWRNDSQMFEFRNEIEKTKNIPYPEYDFQNNQYDRFISLGGNENFGRTINSVFHTNEKSIFDEILVPFHSLVDFFNCGFNKLLSTESLYKYHNTLRCKETLVIYNKSPMNEAQSQEIIENIIESKENYNKMILNMDNICESDQKILFIREWNDGLFYEGMHRPKNTMVANFKLLADAISNKYPNLDYKILFLNFGDAILNDHRMIFSNTDCADNCDETTKISSISHIMESLNIKVMYHDSANSNLEQPAC